MKKEDYNANYLEVLGNSIYVKNGKKVMTEAQFFKKFDKIFPLKRDTLKIVVIKDNATGMCFGTGSVFIEGQQDSDEGFSGYIEDVLILESYQETDAGLQMIMSLSEIGWVCSCANINVNSDSSKNGIKMD